MKPNCATLPLRSATLADIDALVALESSCFASDRLSRRSFRHLLTQGNAALIVDEIADELRGYVLLLFSRATVTARLYSIAVSPHHRQRGIAARLLKAAEAEALQRGCVTLRLEIRQDNIASQTLFKSNGYRPFSMVPDYYEDHMAALRVEKRLLPHLDLNKVMVPYYRQTLEFTCGPASLMMAMQALRPHLALSRKLELQLWREATTIFMTSGHGGCSPHGLALAAHRRGFEVELYLSGPSVFLEDSVRSQEKKIVVRLVQETMEEEIADREISVHFYPLELATLHRHLESGGVALILISAYRIYGEKFPHWVVVTGMDDRCIYTHDPYVDEEAGETIMDSINMPILHREFEAMSRYGRGGQRAVVLLYPPANESVPLRKAPPHG